MESKSFREILMICVIPRKVKFLILCLSWIIHNCLSQTLPTPVAITTKQGLGFRKVSAIAQDARGLIWIGSLKGIQRYDGLRFNTFSSKKGADIYFPGEEVRNAGMLMVDESTLWVIADSKLYAIDMCSYSWEDITSSIGVTGKLMNLQKSKDGNILVSLEDDQLQTLLIYKKNNKRFHRIASAKRFKTFLNSIESDKYGNVWWCTAYEGIRQFTQDGTMLCSFKPDSIKWYGTTLFYVPIFIDNENQIYLFPKSVHQIWKYNPEKDMKEVIADNLPTPVYYALDDRKGNVWFAMDRGIIKYNKLPNVTPQIIDFSPYLQAALNFTNIHQLFEDSHSMLWIATNNGLIKLPIEKQKFKYYLSINGVAWGNEMRGLFQAPNGFIYSFCENGIKGLHELDPRTGKSRLVNLFDSDTINVEILDHAKNFEVDAQRNLVWCLTDKLFKIDLNSVKGYEVEDFTGMVDKFGHNPLALLKDGTLILGNSFSKLLLFNQDTKEKIRIFESSAQFDLIKTECFIEDKSGYIWIGTNKGIFVISRTGKIILQLSETSNPSISKNHVLSMFMDKEDNVWVGTFGGGMNKIVLHGLAAKTGGQSGLMIQQILKTQGISNENVTAILQDNLGYIWASTYNGLSRYDPVKNVFQNYYVEDGLSCNEFNYTSSLKDAQGYLWFGGMNGINRIDPHGLFENKHNPPLALCDFIKFKPKINFQITQLISEDYQMKPFVITPDDSWFQFDWTLPNYFKSDQNRYFIWMEGLDNNWTYNGNYSFIRFNTLAKGSYTLHVKGAESKGDFSPGQLSIPIIVLPVFYETLWFRFASLGGAILLIFGIYRYNMRKRMEMERMRVQIASDLHDEVGSMLSGLAMQSELLQLNDPVNNQSKLENISNLSRSVVQKMRDLVWSIDSRRDSIQNLLEKMQEQASDLFQPKEISFTFEIHELSRSKQLPVLVRQQLFLIFNESITNVVRHSNADSVIFRIGNLNNRFEMSIKDNGTMFKEGSNTGQGLRNIEMRAKKINARVVFDHSNGFEVFLTMRRI